MCHLLLKCLKRLIGMIANKKRKKGPGPNLRKNRPGPNLRKNGPGPKLRKNRPGPFLRKRRDIIEDDKKKCKITTDNTAGNNFIGNSRNMHQ